MTFEKGTWYDFCREQRNCQCWYSTRSKIVGVEVYKACRSSCDKANFARVNVASE